MKHWLTDSTGPCFLILLLNWDLIDGLNKTCGSLKAVDETNVGHDLQHKLLLLRTSLLIYRSIHLIPIHISTVV